MKLTLEQPKAIASQNRVMLFDLALGGHHGNYIRYLIDYWHEHNLAGNLDIVVLPQFLEFHHDVVETITNFANERVKIIPLQPEEAANLQPKNSFKQRARRNFQEWDLLCRYAQLLRATECLIMYFDTCELPLTVGKAAPCPVSGIYFKPTFHYGTLARDCPSRREIIQRWREKLTLSRILRHPQLKTLFCLDPLAIEPLKQFQPQANIVYLPDPVEVAAPAIEIETWKDNLGIEPNRLVLMFFGALDRRKGLYQLVEALSVLPPEICRHLSILLVGKGNSSDLSQIEPQLARLKKATPLQIIQHYQFVSESEVQGYFQLADLILAPYQKHVGMSGILLLSAAAGKPVLSSDYGLMGELVARYDLGMSVDANYPSEIALGITQFVLTYPQLAADQPRRQQFAREHSIAEYATAIFQNISIPSST
ncbi:MAG: glycosyltransferase [Cyanobacteria bacterium J06600_6]